jgi:NIMA (never in mitosis gene a)-related kinase
VLHRDIKCSNIFLTGNNTVKLGDFGISKVLENTNSAAMTVVGTPYYMSPEVCQNHPYTFKSDVWALGCVLYELCTLKHAFSADNLLGLVYKIVQDNYDPIPDIYSQDLKNLIKLLLNKESKERPNLSEILQLPLIRGKMQEFVQSGGATIKRGDTKRQIFIKNKPKTIVIEEEDPTKNMTPKEKVQYRKEMETKRKIEEANKAAADARDNYQTAKGRKFN